MEPVPHLDKKINDVLSDLIRELAALCGDGLVSLYLYGSAAGSGYVPDKSNINTLVILKQTGMEEIRKIAGTYRKVRKMRFVAPLVLTPEYIRSSSDVFPIEFLDIKENSRLLTGEDLLRNISIDTSHLRGECEREIKGQMVRMRGTFLEVEGEREGMEKLIVAAVSNIVFPLKNILRLVGKEVPGGNDIVIKNCCKALNVNESPFLEALELKKGGRKASLEELYTVISAYMSSLEEIARKIDEMKSEGRL